MAMLTLRCQIRPVQGDNKGYLVCKKKMSTETAALCKNLHPCFTLFTEAVIALKFDQVILWHAHMMLCMHKLAMRVAGVAKQKSCEVISCNTMSFVLNSVLNSPTIN